MQSNRQSSSRNGTKRIRAHPRRVLSLRSRIKRARINLRRHEFSVDTLLAHYSITNLPASQLQESKDKLKKKDKKSDKKVRAAHIIIVRAILVTSLI